MLGADKQANGAVQKMFPALCFQLFFAIANVGDIKALLTLKNFRLSLF